MSRRRQRVYFLRRVWACPSQTKEKLYSIYIYIRSSTCSLYCQIQICPTLSVPLQQGALLLRTLLLSHTYTLFRSFSLCIYTSDHLSIRYFPPPWDSARLTPPCGDGSRFTNSTRLANQAIHQPPNRLRKSRPNKKPRNREQPHTLETIPV
jgi:hypothetical protein